MKIGLIFTSFPRGSETFLLSKIHGLKKSDHKVILFGRGELSDYHDELIRHPKLSNNFFIRLVQVFTSLTKLIIVPLCSGIKFKNFALVIIFVRLFPLIPKKVFADFNSSSWVCLDD